MNSLTRLHLSTNVFVKNATELVVTENAILVASLQRLTLYQLAGVGFLSSKIKIKHMHIISAKFPLQIF